MIEQRSQSEESDVDYEKEVLQLGRIWNEIKKNTPEAPTEPAPAPKENDKRNAQSRQNSAKPVESSDKPKARRQKVATVDTAVSKPAQRRRSPNATDNEAPPRANPAAASSSLTQTHLQRNPKQHDPKVITITTNTRQRSSDNVFNHKNEI